ncbi:MAG TPA: hydrogenase maturation protease [Synergistales bacterium]|nr:hydrogenase maturation protease [Synergistales bacterium]
MSIEVVVWGLGNPILGDDSAGLAVSEMLKNKKLGWIESFTCNTVPENYLSPLKRIGAPLLIIVDAADMGIPGGEYRKMELHHFSNISFTTHGIPLDLILMDCQPNIRIIALGIQPIERTPSMEISIKVQQAVTEIVELIVRKKWNDIPSFLP